MHQVYLQVCLYTQICHMYELCVYEWMIVYSHCRGMDSGNVEEGIHGGRACEADRHWKSERAGKVTLEKTQEVA